MDKSNKKLSKCLQEHKTACTIILNVANVDKLPAQQKLHTSGKKFQEHKANCQINNKLERVRRHKPGTANKDVNTLKQIGQEQKQKITAVCVTTKWKIKTDKSATKHLQEKRSQLIVTGTINSSANTKTNGSREKMSENYTENYGPLIGHKITEQSKEINVLKKNHKLRSKRV